MTFEDLLRLLDHVTIRGTRAKALCPAHADRSPSLQVTEGHTGLLLKCWAGCTLSEICTALGVHESELFYDTGESQHPRPTRPRKETPLDRSAIAFQFELAALERRLRAEKVLSAAKGFISLTDLQRDRLMNAVASAYADLETGELFEYVSDGLRLRASRACGGDRHAA